METGTGSTGPGRPKRTEAAWALTLAAVAAEFLVWVLGVFVVPPTGLDELTEFSGRHAAITQLACSAGVLAVLLGSWLFVAVRMRAGRGWARAVLTVVGAVFLLLRVGGLGMDGIDPAWWGVINALPDVLAAAAVVPMYLPDARAPFPSGPRRTT